MKKSVLITTCFATTLLLGFMFVKPTQLCDDIFASNVEALSQSSEGGNGHDYPNQMLMKDAQSTSGVSSNATSMGFSLFGKKNTSPTVIAEGNLGANTEWGTVDGTGMSSLKWYCGGTGTGCSKNQEVLLISNGNNSYFVQHNLVILNNQTVIATNGTEVTITNL